MVSVTHLLNIRKKVLDAFRGLEASLRAELTTFIENIDGFFAQQHARNMAESSFVSVIPSVEGQTSTGANHAERVKVGRNDPCPCGSGKKWKKCGELNTEEHKELLSKIA
jgi:preprotein translocase subunit SecA